ncbi:hypothetical protein CRG98_011780 [Punica granatum]|uniref:Uncharacterized protein n=1 Tax=Punica granatum TaxID=22663 RepID=A0A2I0KH09_PUNGR|nr:hypothetical protein CRG98_011780 [Punica granatum]
MGDLVYVHGAVVEWDVDPDKISGVGIEKRVKGIREVYDVIGLIGHLYQRKIWQLYVKHTPKEAFEVDANKRAEMAERPERPESLEGPGEGTGKLKEINEGAAEESDGGGGYPDGEENSETDNETDLDYVPGDESEDDNTELTQIGDQLKATKEKRKEKLKNVKLHKDLETVIKEATLDKEKMRKRNSKEVVASNLMEERKDIRHITPHQIMFAAFKKKDLMKSL